MRLSEGWSLGRQAGELGRANSGGRTQADKSANPNRRTWDGELKPAKSGLMKRRTRVLWNEKDPRMMRGSLWKRVLLEPRVARARATRTASLALCLLCLLLSEDGLSALHCQNDSKDEQQCSKYDLYQRSQRIGTTEELEGLSLQSHC